MSLYIYIYIYMCAASISHAAFDAIRRAHRSCTYIYIYIYIHRRYESFYTFRVHVGSDFGVN